MSEGGAVLAHSGGAAGTLLGGLTEMAYRGSTDLTPERGMGYGAGNVIAVTYEYGNTFLIVSGLLNALVVIDAFDIYMGRK